MAQYFRAEDELQKPCVVQCTGYVVNLMAHTEVLLAVPRGVYEVNAYFLLVPCTYGSIAWRMSRSLHG